jgi:hypothetical protein
VVSVEWRHAVARVCGLLLATVARFLVSACVSSGEGGRTLAPSARSIRRRRCMAVNRRDLRLRTYRFAGLLIE